MEENPAIQWWKEQAADEFRQIVFSELYSLHLFVEEPLSWVKDYYQFDKEDRGDAIWLVQRDPHQQEYKTLRVEEAKKLSPSQPIIAKACSFWGDVSFDIHWLSTSASVRDLKKKVTREGKELADRINRLSLDVLLAASAESRITAQKSTLDDFLADGSDKLSSRGFSADRFLFPKNMQHRLLRNGIITADDEIESNHYVGKTRTGLFAFWSDELPDDTALIFDSNANIVITHDPKFEAHKTDDPFFVGVGGVVYLNPIIKNVQAIIELNGVEEALTRAKGGDIKQAKSEIMFVDLVRIEELRAITSSSFDLAKLIKLCEELNTCYANDCFLAVTMLTRAVVDHVPPIFGYRSFNEVANNYGGKSFKKSMQHLQNSLRYIADSHLHQPIRNKETLPSRVQVNFSNDLDVLLAEIVRSLK